MPKNRVPQVAFVPTEEDQKALDRAAEKWPDTRKKSDRVRRILRQWLIWESRMGAAAIIDNMLTEQTWEVRINQVEQKLAELKELLIELRTLNTRIEHKIEQGTEHE